MSQIENIRSINPSNTGFIPKMNNGKIFNKFYYIYESCQGKIKKPFFNKSAASFFDFHDIVMAYVTAVKNNVTAAVKELLR